MTTTDDLLAARDLISDPADWCQGHLVQLDGGHLTMCALGALVTASACSDRQDRLHDLVAILSRVARSRGFPYMERGDITSMNDNSTHSEVMEAFDEAIRIAKNEGL